MALEPLTFIEVVIAIIVGLIAIIEFLPKVIKWINNRFNLKPDETSDELGPDIEIELEDCYYTVNDQPISTIQAEFLVFNRGDRSTTVYEAK